eukprot:9124155-Pyramimonas_sp.AAC.1
MLRLSPSCQRSSFQKPLESSYESFDITVLLLDALCLIRRNSLPDNGRRHPPLPLIDRPAVSDASSPR